MAPLHRHVGVNFYDWLVESAFVRGQDQTSLVVSRKKCRSRRQQVAPGKDDFRWGADQHDHSDGHYKVAKKHYRRWMNDRMLRELAPPLDGEQIESLFAPPPWGEKTKATALDRITGYGPTAAADMAAWEPFRNNVDMDLQEAVLQQSAGSWRIQGDVGRAMSAWRTVEHRARDALRRNSSSPLLKEYEDKILGHLRQSGGEESGPLAFDVETSFHRLLLHGLSQFYGLMARSMPMVAAGEEGKCFSARVVLWRKADQNRCDLSLVDFLREVQSCSMHAS